MTAAKKLTFNATSFAKTGEAHRTDQQPVAAKDLHRVLAAKRPGRVPAFTEPTGRLNAFVPKRLLDKLQERAYREKQTISQLVAALLESM